MRRPLVRAGVLLGTGALATVLAALPASAHVTAQPSTAVKDSYTKIIFRVPDESATAGTVKLQVSMPTNPPIVGVRTTPMPGWHAEIVKAPLNPPVQTGDEKITESVRTVTWTADPGTRIGPEEFAEFAVSIGPLPKNAEQLVMPAVQTYDDGTMVSWDAPPVAPGAPEPEHPAPVVMLVAATGDAAAPGSDAEPADTADDTARWLGGIGVALGVLGLGLGLGAVVRTRGRRS